jgi:ribosomal protein L14E/L6E/L27E
MTVSEVTSEKKLMTRFNVKWGHISAMDKYIDIKMVGDQSSVMRKIVEESLFKKTFEQESLRSRHQSLFSPVGQYEHTVAAAYLDQYKVE